MSQTLIDALDALESQVARLSRIVKTADPGKISAQAEAGARNGAIYALGSLPEVTRALQSATTDIKAATDTIKNAAEGGLGTRKALERWKVVGITLAALLSLLTAFVGGVVFMKSGLPLTSETGCSYLGGSIGPQPDGRVACYFWIQ